MPQHPPSPIALPMFPRAQKRKNASLQVLCLPLLRTPCRVSPFPATLTQTPGMGVPLLPVSASAPPGFTGKSLSFIKLQTLLHRQKSQLFCHQANPDSYYKTPGVWGTPCSAVSGIRLLHFPRQFDLCVLCAVACPGLVGVANPLCLASASGATRGFGLVRSYLAVLNRFCTSSPIVAVPRYQLHSSFDQEAPL